MAYRRGERDHRDMLAHSDTDKRSNEAVYYSKPDWMVQAPAVKSNVPVPPVLPAYLTHDSQAPALENYTSAPAPYSEDGSSVFRRDGNSVVRDKTSNIPEKMKPGQKRNAGTRHGVPIPAEGLSRNNDPLWNIERRSAIRGRQGELEVEFRSQGGYTGGTESQMESEGYTPSSTPPVRQASAGMPAKSVYQEQCDQIWSHMRHQARNQAPHHTNSSTSPAAGKALDRGGYNFLTGDGDAQKEMQQIQMRRHVDDKQRQRETEEIVKNHYPPWATHEGEEGALSLKCG